MTNKLCPSFPGYSVNELGDVFSHRTRKKLSGVRGGSTAYIDYSFCKKLSQQTSSKGYKTVGIKTKTGSRPVGVHQLVADAFIGPCPSGLQVRHLDDNPINNHPSNLCYGDSFSNAQDRKSNGNYADGEEHHNAKLTNEQAAKIRELRAQKVKVKDLAAMYRVSISTIESVIYNKSFKVLSTTGKP